MKKILMTGLLFAVFGCGPPPSVKPNIYREEGIYPQNFSTPDALLADEWARKWKSLGSASLVNRDDGIFLSAKHVTDVFMGDAVELGSNECKIFFISKVYNCEVMRVPPLRDAVLVRIKGIFNSSDFPEPYPIATTPVKVGDKVFVEGFHPHPLIVTKSNAEDGFGDVTVPILKNYYEFRTADPMLDMEIVYDSLEATVVKLNVHIRVKDHSGQIDHSVMAQMRFQTNYYFQIKTARNHKFSFAGLSGGEVVRLNKDGRPEVVGIVTAEPPVRMEYDKKGQGLHPDKPSRVVVADTIMITPIDSIKDLLDYAKYSR